MKSIAKATKKLILIRDSNNNIYMFKHKDVKNKTLKFWQGKTTKTFILDKNITEIKDELRSIILSEYFEEKIGKNKDIISKNFVYTFYKSNHNLWFYTISLYWEHIKN